jgi:molybdate transport system substrate-binding protein
LRSYLTFAKGEPLSSAADELHIICAGGFVSAMEHVGPRFENESGHKIFLTVGTPAKTRELMSSGAAFDAAVVTVGSLDEAANAAFAPGSRFSVAKSPVGMGVRADVSAPDVTSLESFRAAIAAVGSVGLSDPKAGTNLAADILGAAAKLGFADELRAKVRYIVGPGSVVSTEVGKGAADAVMTLGTEIRSVENVRYLGNIPNEMGLGTVFDAGSAKRSDNPVTALFLSFLRTEKTKSLMRDTGLSTGL